MYGLKEQVQNNPEDFKQLKMVVCPIIKSDHSEVNYMSWPDNHVSACATNFNQVNKHNVPFYWIGVKDYQKIYKQVGVEPYTGIMTICTLLNYPVQEMYIAGFDFLCW